MQLEHLKYRWVVVKEANEINKSLPRIVPHFTGAKERTVNDYCKKKKH